jgi:selenocysteine-specific elongation factor
MIVATAGHVDHGKTALVRALTGEDTDRLPEEKRRGMSIDLGFAYLPLAGGDAIAFVDVPGHERFVRNMAAGVPGIDLALLVVAADDGPMPQTREHLAILERLGAPRLLVALNKIDRVAPERADAARAEVAALLAGSRFDGAEIIAVSARSGEGIEKLLEKLREVDKNVSPEQSKRRFRMHVDRAFIVEGQGLVATGTVLSGAIGAGDEVQVLPRGLAARVRGLRANRGEATRALAGQRCALQLQGLARGEVERGDAIADAGAAPLSRHLDIELEPFAGLAARGGMVGVHLGTAFLPARLARFGRFARLTFARPVSAWHGDRLVLRDTGSQRLAGAGIVADPMPPERGAARPQRLAFLGRIAGKSAEAAFDSLLESEPGHVDASWFSCAFHLPPDELRRVEAARDLVEFKAQGQRQLMRADRWRAHCERLEGAVAQWHAAHPDAVGPRPAEAGAPLPAVVDFLVEQGRLARAGPCLRLPGHRPVLSAQDEALWRKAAPLLSGNGPRPPRLLELAPQLAMEPKALADFLQRAARAGRVHRVAANRYFLPETIEHLVRLAAELDAGSEGRGFAAAAYRDRSALGRNLTIEVLEYLDEAGYTRRSGDLRRINIRSLAQEGGKMIA